MNSIVAENNEIKEEILKKVKEDQLISYTEFISLYEPYKNRISEIDFAEILGISFSYYKAIKNTGKRAKVFKKKYINISEEEKEKIKQEILKNVQVGQTINYQEFIELYEPYKDKLSEVDFAEMLGISCGNYKAIKNRGTKAKILKKKYINISEAEKEQMKTEVLKKIEIGQLINYTEFIELYEPYKNRISEIDFASILGISYYSYTHIKNRGTKAKVFKKKYANISEEEKEKIKQEVLKRVQAGQLINYQEFLELYEPYKDKLSEVNFAEILGINYSNYCGIKNKGRKAKVFKKKYINISKEEIKESVLKKVEVGQTINYQEFLELYEPYKDKLSEVDFANILGISYCSYMHIKNQGTKAKVFKKKYANISEIELEKIKQEVLKRVQVGQSINYQEFIELYEPYKDKLSEVDFVEILGINYGNYWSIKNKGTKVKILNKTKISEIELEKIKQEVLKRVQVEQSINYQEFLELYEPYKDKLSEVDFAKILGISYSNYNNIKNQGKRAKILKKNKIKISEEEKEKIKQELLKKVSINQSINYQEFLELYKPYKDKLSEVDFAKILGISYSNYKSIKNKGTKARVTDYKTKIIYDRVKFLLKDSRYYSKQELEQITKKYKINLNKLIQLIFNINKDNQVIDLIKCLEVNGQLWIGKISCSKSFVEQYAEYMISIAIKMSNYYCGMYKCEIIKDDIISNSILFIIERSGNIEKNYLNEEQIKMAIASLIGGYIKNNCLWYKGNLSQSLFAIDSDGEEINPFDRGIEDKSINVEKEVIENISQEEIEQYKNLQLEVACLKLLKKYIEIGCTENEAMIEVSKFIGIDIAELIEMLKKYMIEQNQVKETSNGEYILK